MEQSKGFCSLGRWGICRGILSLLLVAGLLSCSVLADRYLFPAHSSFVPSATSQPTVLFQKFSEDFFTTGTIGMEQIGNRQRRIKVMTGEVAAALQPMIAERLAEKKIATRLVDQQMWALNVDSLDGVAAHEDRLLGGQIREFSVHADTVTARVATEFEFQIAVDCYIGQVGEKKVVKRAVRVGQKMLSFSSSQETANNLLSQFLEETAQQVVENIQSFLK